MKPLLLNTFDYRGGAAIATYRLHQGLRAIGLDSQMLVQVKATADPNVLGPEASWQRAVAPLRPTLDRLATYAYPDRQRTLFSPAGLREDMASRVAAIAPDVVHLFWVAGGFLRIETLAQLRRPIVWTLHDMWPFTGGCHYDDECGKYQDACGDCPMLRSGRERDLSRLVWQRKHDSWGSVPIAVVATSQWIADRARASSLFGKRRIEVIPNGINTAKYRPLDKARARAALNLPRDKRLILFSAVNALSDKRKGYLLLAHALRKLAQDGSLADAELVIADDASQVSLYSAADVLVAPSTQENLSNTVMEALACGTPVAAFNVGGMPDMIEHGRSGYLAAPFDEADLAAGIKWLLEDGSRRQQLANAARATALERFAINAVAHRYGALYDSLLR